MCSAASVDRRVLCFVPVLRGCVCCYGKKKKLVSNANPRGPICVLGGKTIHNMFGCGCYFVVECYGSL